MSSKQSISPGAIKTLQSRGYSVQVMYDGDPELYGWTHTSGARQGDVKDRQPYRRTKAQAWADCEAYDDGDVPSKAEPDWVHSNTAK
jgi:hypothetical protein